jgi:hypothetical protein
VRAFMAGVLGSGGQAAEEAPPAAG